MSETAGGVHTFLFADLAGYTALTEVHGDAQAAKAAAEFFADVRSLLAEHQAEEVKAIGDALLVRTQTALDAARLAERVVCGRGWRHRSLGVRVGIHTGTAVRQGNDWFGSAVNIASRVADTARAGEVLLTEKTRDALGDSIAVRSRGQKRFKNVAQPVPLYELALETKNTPRALPIDPVCRVAIEPDDAHSSHAYRGVTYHFCSEGCQHAFAANPARYTRSRSTREHLLVTDTAREYAASRLRRAYTRGRLEQDELEARVARVYAARTRGELSTVTHDLPRRFRRRSPVVVLVRWITRPARRVWRRVRAR
jgi:adenylate cyclase